MKRMRKSSLKLLAAVAAVGMLPVLAAAQYRLIEPPNRLTDNQNINQANNRIGSGGWNTGYYTPPSVQVGSRLQEQYVTGTATGGTAFRGPLPYRDASEFRANYAGAVVDRFIRDSVGAPQPYAPPRPPGLVQPFYGSRATPPPGFAVQGYTGTYAPAPVTPRPDPATAFTAAQLDQIAPLTSALSQPIPKTPQVPLEPRMLTATDLMAMRRFGTDTYASQSVFANYRPLATQGIGGLPLDAVSIERKRRELAQNLGGAQPPQQEPEGVLSRPLPAPSDAPITGSLTVPPVDRGATAAPLRPAWGTAPADASAGERQPLLPWQRTEYYSAMEQRLRQFYQNIAATDEQRHADILRQLRQGDQENQPRSPDTPPQPPNEPDQPGAFLGGVPAPGVPGATTRPAARGTIDYRRIGEQLLAARPDEADPAAGLMRPPPVRITAMANAVPAKTAMHTLLAEVDEMMRSGRYVDAINRLTAAQQVMPNDPLLALARANAELSAGFYAQAENSLRQSLAGDSVVLLAQFDLMRMVGQRRLGIVVNDLKEIAARRPDDAGVMLLLAYVAYNSGYDEQAGVWLKEAEARSGSPDPLLKRLRQHWVLSGGGPTAAEAPPGTTRPATPQ